MNIDDAFLYDLKYGDLSAKFIDNVFCVTEDTYMNEDIHAIIERLVNSGYLLYSGKRFGVKCKYCGYDKFYAIPYNKETNTPVENSIDKIDKGIIGYSYVCGACGKLNQPGDSWSDYDSYSLSDKNNAVVEATYSFKKILDESNLVHEMKRMLKSNYHKHIFNISIQKDFEYLVDIHEHANLKDTIEMTNPIKREYPSKKIAIFNITDNISAMSTDKEIEYYPARTIEDLLQKFNDFIKKILNSRVYRFGIDEFDDKMVYGLEENNVYGIETFSSGNSTYFLAKFIEHGLINNQNGLYITTRNSPEYIINISESYGINLRNYINENKLIIMNGSSTLEKFTGEPLDIWKVKDHISKMVSEISKYVTKYNIKRLVIDSIEPLEINSNEESIRYLFNELRNLDCVIVATKFINIINSNPIEDMFFSGIAEIGTVIDVNLIKNVFIIKKFSLRDNAKRIFEFNINPDGRLELK